MTELVTSPVFAHFFIRALSWLAKRTSSVFASATTRGRQIKANKWLRPRKRLYPAKPKVGIRAVRPNQLWHIDVTIVRLVEAGGDVFELNRLSDSVTGLAIKHNGFRFVKLTAAPQVGFSNVPGSEGGYADVDGAYAAGFDADRP
jgi:hypothetical protein